MKSLSAAICVSVLTVVSVNAQQPAAPPGAAPAAKGNFTECRTLARQNKVTKDQRQTFMRDCMKDIATDCRTKAGQQKFTAEERRAFVRDCTGRPAAKARS